MKLGITGWYSYKNLCEYYWSFLCNFWTQTVMILPDQNLSTTLNQNVLILLVSNMYNKNMGTVWGRKLSTKSWYSKKSL